MSSIKTNVETVSLIGDFTSTDCTNLYNNFNQITKKFSNHKKFLNYLNVLRPKISTESSRVISIFTRDNKKKYLNIPQNLIYWYLVSSKYAERVQKEEDKLFKK
jgi:hypothetical protein